MSAMAVLENPKAALPKKRQVMRATCGDYRTKMEKEESAFRLGKLTCTVDQTSNFIFNCK